MTQQENLVTTPEQSAAPKSRRIQKVGRVVSNKMDKTIVVAVESLKKTSYLQTNIQTDKKISCA